LLNFHHEFELMFRLYALTKALGGQPRASFPKADIGARKC
jgi:hypothetical protein